MNAIDLSPLYKSSIGFDRLASALNSAMHNKKAEPTNIRYNIEVLDESRYAITLDVAGFAEDELAIEESDGVLIIKGTKSQSVDEGKYVHQGIELTNFEQRFNLAEFVSVTDASLSHGLLSIRLFKELPETMKPKKISIGSSKDNVIEHKAPTEKVA